MAIPIDLPPELEAAARKEAERRHIPVEQLFLQGVIAQLPDDACPDAIRTLFTQWREEWQTALRAAPPGEEFDPDEIVRNVTETRAGGRIPIPPEQKGVTW